MSQPSVPELTNEFKFLSIDSKKNLEKTLSASYFIEVSYYHNNMPLTVNLVQHPYLKNINVPTYNCEFCREKASCKILQQKKEYFSCASCCKKFEVFCLKN
jgi:hypothetical protein